MWHAVSSLRRSGFSLVVVCGFFFSIVAGHGFQGAWALQLCPVGSRVHGLYSLGQVGSLIEVCKLSSCGERAQLPPNMWDLSSPTRDRTRFPCIVRRILYHWTSREVPLVFFLSPWQHQFVWLDLSSHQNWLVCWAQDKIAQPFVKNSFKF